MKQTIAKIILGSEAVALLVAVIIFAVKTWPGSAYAVGVLLLFYGFIWSLNQL